ncbi:hypothetical protein BH09PLA1_BH09PLA1_05940 [soil metagenome]
MNDQRNTLGRMRFAFSVRCACLAVCLLIVTFICSISFAGPDDGLSPVQRHLRRGFHDRVGWHLVNGVWMQASGECNWDDLFRLSWHGSQLAVDAKPSDKAAGLLRGGRTAAVEIGPGKDLYQLAAPKVPFRRQGAQVVRNPIPLRNGEQAAFVTASQMPEVNHFEDPRPIRPQILFVATDILRVTAQADIDGSTVLISFMSQPPGGTELSVSEIGKPDGAINFSVRAPSLEQLHAEHRLQVRKYLAPLLQALSGSASADLFAPGAADAYGVFGEIEPSPESLAAVRKILPRMLDPDPEARNDALADLRKLGAPGVCAAAKLERSELAAQQIVFIEQLLRENSRHAHAIDDAAELAALRNDAAFLVDCLEAADPRVRAAAIRELSRVLNRRIETDPADARASAQLAHELHDQLN